jgi:hypothetical protein
MAVVRGIALKVQAGSGRCHVYDVVWDERGGLTETGRALSGCDQPPVTTTLGSGVCAEHAVLFGPTEGGWSNN